MIKQIIFQSQESLWPGLESSLLNSPCTPVNEANIEEAQATAGALRDMLEYQKLAVGLAANQMGCSLSVAAFTQSLNLPPVVFNPQILSISGKKDRKRESCMSVWGLSGEVERREKVLLQYQDPELKFHKVVAKGFAARVIQHEVDHLNGILYTNKVCGEIIATDIFIGHQPIKD